MTFSALPNDIGKTATFYLTTTVGTTKFMLANGVWIAATDPLQVAASAVLPEAPSTLPLYTGILPIEKYAIQAAYQTADGNKVEATAVFNVLSADYLAARDALVRTTGRTPAGTAATLFASRKQFAAAYPSVLSDQVYAEQLYLKVSPGTATSSALSNLSDRQKQKLLEDIAKSLYLDNGQPSQ